VLGVLLEIAGQLVGRRRVGVDPRVAAEDDDVAAAVVAREVQRHPRVAGQVRRPL
jgi:hypothetical protein